VFCEGVQCCLQVCLSSVKIAAFQFYLQLNRRVGWVEGDNHVGLVTNSLVKRKCETVHCDDATASSFVTKVQGEDFTHFHTVTVKRHSSMQNWLFGLPGQILCE
jgi:hypothetical protein